MGESRKSIQRDVRERFILKQGERKEENYGEMNRKDRNLPRQKKDNGGYFP
jgi:hypothetical protein